MEDAAPRRKGQASHQAPVSSKNGVVPRVPLRLRDLEVTQQAGIDVGVERSLNLEHVQVFFGKFAHAFARVVQGGVGRVHIRAGVQQGVGVVMVPQGAVARQAGADGLVASVHGDEVDVDVHQQVRLGDTPRHFHLLRVACAAQYD